MMFNTNLFPFLYSNLAKSEIEDSEITHSIWMTIQCVNWSFILYSVRYKYIYGSNFLFFFSMFSTSCLSRQIPEHKGREGQCSV